MFHGGKWTNEDRIAISLVIFLAHGCSNIKEQVQVQDAAPTDAAAQRGASRGSQGSWLQAHSSASRVLEPYRDANPTQLACFHILTLWTQLLL